MLTRRQELVKRAADVALSGLALVAALPVIVAAAALVRLEDGGPALYRQRRAGRGGREFELLKFRSMRVNDVPAAVLGQVRGDNPLITRVGRVLRRFKIDELPQLVNVLRGEMSLVGPRPTMPEQAAEYDAAERRRLLVRPGITGWAQVNGNVELGWAERIAMDVWYVDHWSPALDVWILLRTVGVVLLGERQNATALREAVSHAHGAGRRG